MTLSREPTLVDLLNDPVIHLVMKSDGVTKTDILELYCQDKDIPANIPPAFVCSTLGECCRTLA